MYNIQYIYIQYIYKNINSTDSAHPLLQPPLFYNLCHQSRAPHCAWPELFDVFQCL